ncbi:hypothetical protein POM88_002685 [Heracleum sosnowskyi]|uniref:Uncharacterized protein n=1 Tax=Heracleum sosnowskyi TaxID=360622 RepID=A0AAD8N648_9APIA|nr:hypothetical protein POM88_002685 [Heracleum sosnowskyi]
MAHLRFKSRFCPAPPPPSPLIARRSTSCVREDSDSFTDIPQNAFIDETLLTEDIQCLSMAGIDYNLILSRDAYSIGCLLRSASDFGMFRISNYGILAEDFESTLADAGCVFQSSSVFLHRVDDHREEFVWSPSMQVLGHTRKYRRLSEKMENVAAKLDSIAEELGQIFTQHASKQQYHHKIKASESTLSLCRHNHPFSGVNSSPNNKYEPQHKHCKHALSLHVPVDEAEFFYHTEQSPSSSFYTGPDTIVVTIGEQLAEWSNHEFKFAYGEVYFKPLEDKASFAFEFQCSPSSIRRSIISLYDQIGIIIIIAGLCKFLLFGFDIFDLFS